MTASHLEPVFQLIPPATRRDDPAYERDDGSFRKHLAAAEPDRREATAPPDRPTGASGDEMPPVGKDDPNERRDKSAASDTGTEPQHRKTETSESADSPEDAPQHDDPVASNRKRTTDNDTTTDGENPVDAEAGTTDSVTVAAVEEPADVADAAAKGDIAKADPHSSSASGQRPTNAKAGDASTDKSEAAKLETVGLPAPQTGATGDSDAVITGHNDGKSTAVGTGIVGAAGGVIAETSAENSSASSETTTPADAVRQSPSDIRQTRSDADAAPVAAHRPAVANPEGATNRGEVATSDERPNEGLRRGGRARSNSANAARTQTSSTTLDPKPAINHGQLQEAPAAPESVALPDGEDADSDRVATQFDDRPATPTSPSTARPPAGAPFAGSTLGRPTRIGTAAGTPNDGRPRIDPVRFVARVAKALRMADERGGQLRLRLSPPELGSIRLELAVKNGAVTATIETETMAARSALLDNLPLLRERLVQQDFRVEQFDVNVRDEAGGNAHEQATENRERQNVPVPRDQQSDASVKGDELASETPPVGRTVLRGDETLNVVA